MRRCSLLLASLSFASCTNTASTEIGDKTVPILNPTALGQGSRNATLNQPGDGGAANGEMVSVTGSTFLWLDTYAETPGASSIGSLYVQDFASNSAATPPFSGNLLYKTVFVPASLQLAPGDVIDFTGEYTDYSGPSTYQFPAGQTEPEMYEPIVTFRFDYSPPLPTPVHTADLANSAINFAPGYRWESMLVIVTESLAVSGSMPDNGRQAFFLTPDTSTTAFAVDNELMALNPSSFPTGTKLKSVTGIVTYFNAFHIAPRTPADIVFENGQTLADIDGGVDAGPDGPVN